MNQSKLAYLLSFYDPSELQSDYNPATLDQALSKIATKDKYLNLGYAGQKIREDFDIRPLPTFQALESFPIESELDQKIHQEWLNLSHDYLAQDNPDGRVFRDCRWNYHQLYALADPLTLQEFNYLESVWWDNVQEN